MSEPLRDFSLSNALAAERSDKIAKVSSFAVAVLVHVVLIAILSFIVVQLAEEDPPELSIISGPTTKETNIDMKLYTSNTQPKPSAPSRASNLLTSTSAASMSIPSLDVESVTPSMGIGDSFGMGFGSGAGGKGGGGGVTFFGSKSTAQRVAFIVDVSRSLSDRQFAMIKEELSKSLSKLSASTDYQVIFFSGPAWFAEDKYDEKARNVVSGGKKFGWKQNSINDFFPTDGGKNAPIYKVDWLKATPTILKKTMKDIDKVTRSSGTDWRWPLKYALWLKPKPDVIFFLTDGAVKSGDEMVDEVLKVEKKANGPDTKINTIAMMQPRATENLLNLAKKTNAQFTIVHENGKTEIIKR
jgi:hypothetical protein